MLAAQRPALYEGTLALLHRFAATPESGPPMLELLRHEHLVADQLEAVSATLLPPKARPLCAWRCCVHLGLCRGCPCGWNLVELVEADGFG